jgi:pimeloyl-ACP methyl ester carboxylesterase
MPFVKADEIQLFYEEHGSGPPLLMIQGLGYPSGMWFRQVPELSKYYRTIVFDNRGVGKSDKPDEEYTVALMAADAACVLRVLDIERAHVIGVSLGGYIAQELALKNPQLVDRLILMSTSCGGSRYLELTKTFWEEVASLQGLPPQEIIRQGMALATTQSFFLENPEIFNKSLEIRFENLQPLYAFVRQSTAGSLFDSRESAHLITRPTLILAGEQDRVMPLTLTEELAEKIPEARLRVFPNAAHLLFLEKTLEVNQAILEFLAEGS